MREPPREYGIRWFPKALDRRESDDKHSIDSPASRKPMFSRLIFFPLLASVLAAEPMKPFTLSQVRIGEGVFKDSMEVNRRVLDGIGPERALYCFRVNAKLPTGDAKPLEGWGSPEPGGAFPGCYEAHYLTAISRLYAQTGDVKLLDQVNYMIAELARCQQRLGGTYLFASPEEEFEPARLDGVAWYRMHKLMEGLIAANRDAGNQQALEILNKLARWIDKRVTTYGDRFEAVKKTDYGGMTEALENLYEITRDPRHREMAIAWEERTRILDRFHRHEDFNEHANTLLAKMVGCARIAEVENSGYHRTAAENFWDLVAGSGKKIYATGGTSIHEGMPPVGRLANSQAKMPQETCVSYNLLKVSRSLYHLTGDLKYIDYLERSLFNSILGSQDPETGWKSYYQPLNANANKDYRSPLTGCYCCNGTGLENPCNYGNAIYAHSDSGLRVNLFIASTLAWEEKGVEIVQATRFPSESVTALTVKTKQPVTLEIGIRVPAWCAKGFTVAVNGEPWATDAKPGSYALIKREWQSGDRIDCRLPMSFSTYPMPDKPSQLAFLYGPLVMVGEGARPSLDELVGDREQPECWINRLDSWFKPVPDHPLKFSARDDADRLLSFIPYFQVGGKQFFTGYWNVRKTPARVDDHNIALGRPTTCSEPDPVGVNVECFMTSAKAVDGLYGGEDDWYVKWFPNGAAPHWLIVDLGKPCGITGVEWFLAEEDIKERVAYRYQIESSDDQVTWRIYADASDNGTFVKSYPHHQLAKARYMRLTILPSPEAGANAVRVKVAEFKIYGEPQPAK